MEREYKLRMAKAYWEIATSEIFHITKKTQEEYTLFQNGRHFSILLFPCKLALLTTLSNVKFKRIFKLERGQKGQFAIEQGAGMAQW